MLRAKLTMLPETEAVQCWDNIKLIIHDSSSNISRLICFEDRDSLFGLFADLSKPDSADFSAGISVSIDQKPFSFNQYEVALIYDVLGEYLVDYILFMESE